MTSRIESRCPKAGCSSQRSTNTILTPRGSKGVSGVPVVFSTSASHVQRQERAMRSGSSTCRSTGLVTNGVDLIPIYSFIDAHVGNSLRQSTPFCLWAIWRVLALPDGLRPILLSSTKLASETDVNHIVHVTFPFNLEDDFMRQRTASYTIEHTVTSLSIKIS